ncbi:hypothetical protein BC831DRAFT_56289 [Entophlyctis helioformis]|nr:hypothetical protein BC831DRAFT_56289 [Entophlyctis helioformis]
MAAAKGGWKDQRLDAQLCPPEAHSRCLSHAEKGSFGLAGCAGSTKHCLTCVACMPSCGQPNLTATQKQELERRIKALELEMNKNKQQTQEHKLFQKYKYVRFVGMSACRCLDAAVPSLNGADPSIRTPPEQKKILRQIARTERRLAAVERQGAAPQQGADGDDDDASAGSNDEDGQGDAESLKEALGSLKLRLAYITHYPRDLKYIALFPKEPLAETSPSALMQAQIFEKLRSAMDKGLTERPGFVLRMHNMDATLNADSDDDGQGAQEQRQEDAEMDEEEQEEEQEQEEEGQRRDHSTGDRSASKQDRHAKTSKAQRRAPAGKSGASSATAAGRRKDASSSRADSGQDDDFFL